MTRASLLALTLLLSGCAEDTPTITQQPEPEQTAIEPGAEIPITATEYAFEGMPETLAEGEYTFTLENGGEEPHELYLAYITGPQSIEELIELPEKKVTQLTQAVDRVEAKPGGSDSFTAGLVPGRFGYVCFVQSPDGTPHAFLGMLGELTVA